MDVDDLKIHSVEITSPHIATYPNLIPMLIAGAVVLLAACCCCAGVAALMSRRQRTPPANSASMASMPMAMGSQIPGIQMLPPTPLMGTMHPVAGDVGGTPMMAVTALPAKGEATPEVSGFL